MKKAFTLSEVLIVLVIIGVLTAILMPVAFQSSPDENVMKFKKAHSTLLTVIRELVNSDKYFANGDLGIRYDGLVIDGKHENDKTYMCNSMADLMNTKKVNCSEYSNYTYSHVSSDWDSDMDYGDSFSYEPTTYLDEACKTTAVHVGEEILTPDNVSYYQATPGITFGIDYAYQTPNIHDAMINGCNEGEGLYRLTTGCKGVGFLRVYKTFCIDIDGINRGEDPFGYGIRIDGKILLGARAQEWVNKKLQK